MNEIAVSAPDKPLVEQAAPFNTLGLVGLVLSAMGLFTCGILSPLGLLFSTLGMGREPRVMAIIGLVLGILGSSGLVVGALVFSTSLFIHYQRDYERVRHQADLELQLERADERVNSLRESMEKARQEFEFGADAQGALDEIEEKLRRPEEFVQPPADRPDASPTESPAP